MPSTFALSFGAYAEPSWIGMKVIVRRSAPLVDGSGNVSEVTWSATVAPDGTGSITGLPCNDDGSTYRSEWQALSYLPTPGNKTFQVLSTQGSTIDYDTLAGATGSPNAPVQFPLVTSVVGQTGPVTGAQIAADPALAAAFDARGAAAGLALIFGG